jgi:hypothetical protein
MKDKFDELLEKLNKLEISQNSCCWEECIPNDIWIEYFQNNYKSITSGLNIDKHRWYETSIAVICIYDRFLGIEHISDLFSENSSCEDCCVTIRFFEMREVQSVTYIPIKS